MGRASYIQSTFLSGEWSQAAQGRVDREDYRGAMARCYNSIPIEEGSVIRRPGVQFIAHTKNGIDATVREFHFAATSSYVMEFSEGNLRFSSDGELVTEDTVSVSSISSASPALVITTANHGYTTGDTVIFNLVDLTNGSGTSVLMKRQFEITVTGTDRFTIKDALTNTNVSGSTISVGSGDVTVSRVIDLVTPYTGGAWRFVQVVQDDTTATILQNGVAPHALVNDGSLFDITEIDFLDGPYLDPTGGTCTPSATSGVGVTLTFGADHGIGAADIGRLIRLWSAPDTWLSATAYAVGDQVEYGGVYWYATKASTDSPPGATVDAWIVDTTAAFWTWAEVTGWTSSTVVTVTIRGQALRNTDPIKIWRLGLFCTTHGFPTNGTYHQGRLWLTGVLGNRIDSSKSNDPYNFSPTDPDGTVADDNAISAVLQAEDINTIFWMSTCHQGMICGTAAGEWLIQASALNDPLTPTSIQADMITKFGSKNAHVVRAPMSLVFIGRHDSKVIEYVPDPSFGKYVGANLSMMAKHLVRNGMVEFVYQQEPTPILWGLDIHGDLVGCTYKRESPYGTQSASFSAWHWHRTGGENGVRGFRSLAVGPSPDGSTNSLTMVTVGSIVDPIYWVETMSRLADEQIALNESAYLDSFIIPSTATYMSSGNKIRAYGLWPFVGQEITVFAAGVDCGEFTVSSTGYVDLPLDVAGSLFTTARVTQLSANTSTFAGHDVYVDGFGGTHGHIPIVVGYNYTSQGQIVRPVIASETGSRIGPSLGQTRRTHQVGTLLYQTQGIYFGTDFNNLRPANFKTTGGAQPLPLTTLFSGVHWDTLDDTYSYDSMICWEVNRPYPATVLAIEGFIVTTER